MKKVLIIFTVFTLTTIVLLAQDEKPFKTKGTVAIRYMSTNNSLELADFNAFVGHGHFKASYELKPWLSFSGQVNGVFVPSTKGLKKRDFITGSGPIYEANLFNLRTMSAHSEFALPILNAQINHNGHMVTLGRFIKNAQAFHPEQWPFPNALEGIWYENYKAENTSWQLAVIHKAMPRFSGDFETIGNSMGVAGFGVNPDGSPSGYRNNVNSNALIVGNYNRLFSSNFSVDIWDYFIEGVMNTLLVEPKMHFPERGLNLSMKGLIQTKVGEGGNSNEQLRYKTDPFAIYLGLRVEKQIGLNTFQLNFTRITDDGRLLMPREWGFEPFYTFQKRTRIEGSRDVLSIMAKWIKNWSSEDLQFEFISSLGKNHLPRASDYARNKYQVPSHVHIDAELSVQPLKKLTGLVGEILVAYRFLSENLNGDESLRINQADFFHTDIRLTYSF